MARNTPTAVASIPLKPGSPEWWERRMARRRRDTLTVERITAAALAILDREGLEALTMRRVASELGVAAPSLYRHVESREALLVEVTESVLGEIDLDVPAGPWQQQATWLARSFRAAFLAHPGVAELLPKVNTLGPNALRSFEKGLDVCLEAGFPDDLAIAACQAIAFLVRSFAVFEAGDLDVLMVSPGVLRAPLNAHPHLKSSAAASEPVAADEFFEFFLTATISALDKQLKATRRKK